MAQHLAAVSVSQSFQNLLNTVVRAIPTIVVFLVILVIGWVVARLLSRIVDMLLRRVHFDRFVERGVVGQALERSHTDATSLIAKIVYYTLLLITLQMAFGVFGPNPISVMINGIVAWLPWAMARRASSPTSAWPPWPISTNWRSERGAACSTSPSDGS